LGKFDRVEFLAPQYRVVVQARGDSNVLMRSNTKGREITPAAPVGAQALDSWLDLQVQTKGVLACGVVRPDGTSVNRSHSADLKVEVMNRVWRQVVATFELTDQNGLPATTARWIFEQTQLYSLKRSDGVVFGVLLNKDPKAVDVAAVDRSFVDFNKIQALHAG
jgi:hypothetical protein